MDLKLKPDQLVEVDQVGAHLDKIFSAVRQRLLATSSKTAPLVHAEESVGGARIVEEGQKHYKIRREAGFVSGFKQRRGGVTNMSERKLVGTVTVDSGEIAIVDPSLILMMEDFLKVPTGIGNGNSPVYFEKDDAKGGCGKSRIIIELDGMDES